VLDCGQRHAVSVGPPYFNGAVSAADGVVDGGDWASACFSRWKDTPVKLAVWPAQVGAGLALRFALSDLRIWIGDHHLAVGHMLLLVFWVVGMSFKNIRNERFATKGTVKRA